MSDNPFSPEYFEEKQWRRVQTLKPEDFEPWDEAKARYIDKKIEPLHTKFRESDHDWFKDWSRRRGIAMHSSDLIYHLQKLNPHIFVQQQINFPDDWGVYLEVAGRIQYLSAVPKGWLTEFSYSIVDAKNLPVEERRGWRTVIVLCLLKGALTWEQVFNEFGDPEDGFNDARWQDVTRDVRHGEDEVWARNQSALAEGL